MVIKKKWYIFGDIPLSVFAWCYENQVEIHSEIEEHTLQSYKTSMIFAGKRNTTVFTYNDEQEIMLKLMLGDNMECIYIQEEFGDGRIVQTF